jgi:hypothetical protein
MTPPHRAARGLVGACDDSALLAFPLWPKQRELLAAVEQGPRLHVWRLGRRSGKTTLAAIVGLWDCLLRPELDELVRRREKRYSVAVATSLRQSRLYVRAARSIVEESPLLARLVEQVTDDEIVFTNGTVLASFPATSRGARGWPISTILFDEAAHMLDTEGNQAAEPLWRSLVPSTAQFGDAARIIVASTPWGASGWFADICGKAETGELEDARAWHLTSAEVNATLDPRFLSREHARDPEGFRGEYMAELIGSGGAYMEADLIADAVAERAELGREDATGWVLGVDLGFAADPTGAVLVGRDPAAPERLRVGLARAWAPQRSDSFEGRRHVEDTVLGEVADLARYFDARIVCDQHMAPQVSDFFRRRGVRVETVALTAESKSLAFAELRSRINTGGVELYPNPDLLGELRGLRSQYRAGRAAVVTPRTARGHSDMAVACALAVWAQRNPPLSQSPSFGGEPSLIRDRLEMERAHDSITTDMKF